MATPMDSTRAGPLPANVSRDAEEKQVVDDDYNYNGDRGLTSPTNAQPDSVHKEELDDATGTISAIPPVGPEDTAAGDVVSVPLAKFEQLVELLAEVVRESKLARKVQADLEQGNANIVRNRNETNKCHSHCNFPHGQYLGEQEKAYRQEAIHELWNSAEPWDRARLWEIPE
ncbi:hypothetical protein VF21_05918 [Pseudogymnoascus sp. 05NY08]|nr:hypothetical protein VF21_05918 [Pseudogymnoascus sp. 05NY08]